MSFELRHGDYLVSDDPARLDRAAIHAYLNRTSYWAKGIPREIVDRSLDHSLCLGVYTSTGEQVGLARVITDFATYGWLCDVFVLETHRRHGLGKALVRAVLDHPRLQTVRRLALGTQDAHGLYSQFGFTPLPHPETHMERRNPAAPRLYQR
ncbi:MAG TPA: GNAT family N-acetyltransferase [Opitutus sp.]|nr:GNAT family N-acetyltransferase [Opitutus sp.]